MKTLLYLATLTVLALPARAQLSPVRLEVRQNVKTESKGKTNDTKTQIRSLTINLQNNSQQSFDSLVVKYWFFARDMKNNDVSVLTKGERKSSLASRGRDTVESETATSTYTNEHFEVERGRNRGNNKGGNNFKVKKIEASGKKITGYAVKVMNGGSVVAEYYSEPSLKARVGGGD